MSLAIIGIISRRIKIASPAADANPSTLPLHPKEMGRGMRFLSRIITILSFIVLFEILLVLITGGLNFTIMGIKVRSTRIHNPLTILFILVLVRLLFEHRFRIFIKSIYFSIDNHRMRFYLMVLIISFIFSLGPIIHFNNKEIMYGPYFILRLLPGFDGLRVPARFIIMAALSVSIFASFGVLMLLKRFSILWKRVVVTVIIVLLLLFESLSIPLPTPSVAVGDNIPEVYKWLANEKSDFAILELPMPKEASDVWKENKYAYYSTYHWKKLVNGYSGYFPPAYDFLYQEGMKGFPSNSSVGLLGELGIRYLIIHSADYGKEEWESIKNGLQNYGDVLKPFKQFGNDYVYEAVGNEIYQTRKNGKEIPRDKWVLKASAPGAELAIDSKIKTRWTTGHPQKPSDFVEVDLGEIKNVSKISLELGPDSWDYPRGYRIESSKDGKTWDIVKAQNNTAAPFNSFVRHPKAVEFEISFPTVYTRFIKIIQTGESKDRYWSIREIHLYE